MADEILEAQIKRVAETSDLLDGAEKAMEQARVVYERASTIHHLAKRELESLIRARISAQRERKDTVGATGEGTPLPNGTM